MFYPGLTWPEPPYHFGDSVPAAPADEKILYVVSYVKSDEDWNFEGPQIQDSGKQQSVGVSMFQQ